MRQWNAGISGNRDGRAHTGNDFEGDTGIGQRLGLFAAASENKRIAAFEPHDFGSLAGRS